MTRGGAVWGLALALLTAGVLGLRVRETRRSVARAIDAAKPLIRAGRYDEAAALLRPALAIAEHYESDDPLLLADVLHELGGVERARERFAEAEPFARRAVDVRAEALGFNHVAVAADRASLAAILAGEGKNDEAIALLISAIATFDRTYGPIHDGTAVALNNLAALYEVAGDLESAEALYRRALAMKDARSTK